MSDNKQMMDSLQELMRANKELMETLKEDKQKHLEALAAKDELYEKQNEQLASLVEKLTGAAIAADGEGDRRVHHAPPPSSKICRRNSKGKNY